MKNTYFLSQSKGKIHKILYQSKGKVILQGYYF
jgi:hypothetical protein